MPIVSRRDVLVSGLAASAFSAVSSRAWARANALSATDHAVAVAGPREKLLFDFGWKFLLGSGSDPLHDLDFGKGQGDFAKTGDFEFATGKFDDSKWRTLNLPHDWAVELPFVWDKEQQDHGFKPLGRRYPETSVGWYRRSFDIPAADLGKRITLDFDGAFRSAIVFVNGCFIGRNDNGYAPFCFDISDFLHYGEKNYVVVRMDASFGDGWFYEGAGIYRHVWLVKQDTLRLGQWESYVRANTDASGALLSLGTVVLNGGENPENARVRWQILDAGGKTVASAEASPQYVQPDGSALFTATAKFANPALWTPETPILYSTLVTVEGGGKVRDGERVSFGVRSLAFDRDKGFFLNGKSVKIQGTCNHQDHAGVGAAVPDRLQYFRVGVLKEMGSNAIRTSHNMPTPELVEACDRMGLMMMCETRQMSSNPEAMAQLETMIKRYRNSPSIILWSMGNEEGYLNHDVVGERVIAAMQQRAHELDPTRACSAAVNNNFGTGVSKVLDVMGFNYNLKVPDEYHKTHPNQPSIGSETASAISTRGEYFTDPLRNVVSAYDTNQPGWGELAEEWWKFYMARDWLSGGFAWTGFDYRGEPTPYGWPSVNSQFGIVDTCGYPKDTFFYYKAWWGKEPVLHLFPHWNFAGKDDLEIPVWVHSNLDSVELFVNGASLGSKNVERLGHVEWKVKYAPGVIEARGTKDGKVVLTEKRETTGEAKSIKLTLDRKTGDRTTIDADGEDVAVLRVEALDAEGRHVPTAGDLIEFKVTGAGTLIGVGNGDPNCHESDKEPRRSLYNGLAQVILQSNKEAGEITVEATAGGWNGKLTGTKLTIRSQKVALRAAL